MSDQSKAKDDPRRISQTSHGPYSPNIVGHHNLVTSFSVNTGRRLTEAQKTSLAQILSPYPCVNGHDLLWAMMGDGESIAFARDLLDAFRRAGWNLPNLGFGQMFNPSAPPGLTFIVHSDAEIPPSATALMAWFSVAGIGGTYESDAANVVKGEFKLIVGYKP